MAVHTTTCRTCRPSSRRLLGPVTGCTWAESVTARRLPEHRRLAGRGAEGHLVLSRCLPGSRMRLQPALAFVHLTGTVGIMQSAHAAVCPTERHATSERAAWRLR
jgi:hypothetical protein